MPFKLTKDIEKVLHLLVENFNINYEDSVNMLAKEWDKETTNVCQEQTQDTEKDTEKDTELQKQRQVLFEQISNQVKDKIKSSQIIQYKTKKGDTQKAERQVITDIKEILDSSNIFYTEAGSQQSKDFRNVGKIGLDIEVKKADTSVIYFNDTCPNKDINYIIFVTGKETKKYEIPPQVVCINGYDLVKESPWINEYQFKLEQLKNEYARGDEKKKLSGCISVYPRPTYKANIQDFLTINLKSSN